MVYLKKLGSRRAGSNGVVSFQLQSKDSSTLHIVEKRLRERGYIFNAVPQTPGSDRHGYSFSASFELIIPRTFKIDLKQFLNTNTPPARIEDDIHANGLSIIDQVKGSTDG